MDDEPETIVHIDLIDFLRLLSVARAEGYNMALYGEDEPDPIDSVDWCNQHVITESETTH